MSRMSNVKKCQQCQICPDMLRSPHIFGDPSRSVKIQPDQSRSYEICLIMSKCQPNCQNVNQFVKMSIELSNCHNIKCHVLSECVA